MRRLVFSVIVASGLVMIGAGPVFAEAAPTAAATKAVPGKKMCKVVDPRINEASGLVATNSGYIVINDSTDVAKNKRVFFLDEDCKVKNAVAFSGGGPRDTEDMVLSADGQTLWISDAGDNNASSDPRPSISVWTMPVTGKSEPKIHRLVYPEGEHYDSEALLLTGKNVPIIVTKGIGKPAVLFEPATALKTDNETGVPLKKVGEFQPPETDTSGNTLARIGSRTVTGGAIAPDGTKVALRTYTDAYEWDVTDGDVLAALKATPRKTPLENEPFGEAITYSSDGKYFYTVSDMQGATDTTGDNANYILRYTPATKVVAASTDGASGGDKATGTAWYKNLSLDDITYMVGGIGLLGAILVGFGVVGIVRARKKPPLEPASKVVDGGAIDPLPGDAETEMLTVGGPPGRTGGAAQGQRPGVYGGGARPGGAQQPGVYGGAPATAVPPRGGVPAAPAVPGRGGVPAAPAVPARGGTPQRGGAPQRGGVYGGQGGGAQQGGGRPVPPAGRPPQGGHPAGRPPQGGQPASRPPQGGQPAGRPPQGGQPASRPPQGGQPAGRPPQGGQPAGRPPQGGGAQPGGRPGRSGVYGAPPPPPPPAPGRSGPPERPSGSYGSGQPDGRRQVDAEMNSYADASGPRSRRQRYDNPGYGR